jgi:NAD-dependent dihydropyrimidine dehydrogenase PreA subunit
MTYTFLYFSPTRETKKINDYIAKGLGGDTIELTDYRTRITFDFQKPIECLILSFPVYAQDVPQLLKPFIRKLKGKYVVINVIFGSVSAGKALTSASRMLKKNGFTIIGASTISAHHCYEENHGLKISDQKLNILDPLIVKLKEGDLREVMLPREHKNPFAGVLPGLRSRISVRKPVADLSSCIHCHQCIDQCPMHAIGENLKVSRECIRCMRCVDNCPTHSRKLKRRLFLSIYLNRYLNTETTDRIYR